MTTRSERDSDFSLRSRRLSYPESQPRRPRGAGTRKIRTPFFPFAGIIRRINTREICHLKVINDCSAVAAAPRRVKDFIKEGWLREVEAFFPSFLESGSNRDNGGSGSRNQDEQARRRGKKTRKGKPESLAPPTIMNFSPANELSIITVCEQSQLRLIIETISSIASNE